MPEPIGEVANTLYALPPDAFTEARDAAVAKARAAGDRAAATAIGKLRRPTVAAWLVNLLVAERSDALAELFDLGAALRDAQHDLRGPRLRELTVQRRTAVASLVATACDLAVAAGAARRSLPVAQVEATLNAALSNDAIADEVRTGRLVKSVQYDGFGELPRPRLVVLPGGGDRDGGGDQDGDGDRDGGGDQDGDGDRDGDGDQGGAGNRRGGGVQAGGGGHGRGPSRVGGSAGHQSHLRRRFVEPEDHRQRLVVARATLDTAEAALGTAEDAVRVATEAYQEIERRLVDLRRERVAAQAALARVDTTRQVAEAEVTAARRAVVLAERAARDHT